MGKKIANPLPPGINKPKVPPSPPVPGKCESCKRPREKEDDNKSRGTYIPSPPALPPPPKESKIDQILPNAPVFYPNNSGTGWTCPKCKRVYSPSMWDCPSCNLKIRGY